MRGWQVAVAVILALLVGYAAGQVIPLRNNSAPESLTSRVSLTSSLTTNSGAPTSTNTAVSVQQSTSKESTAVNDEPLVMMIYNLSQRESIEAGGFIISDGAEGATVSLLNLTLSNTAPDEITSLSYGLQSLTDTPAPSAVPSGSTQSYHLTIIDQGPVCSGNSQCIMGITPSVSSNPSPGVETLNVDVSVTYSDGEQFVVPVTVPVFSAGGHYTYTDGASYVAPTIPFPSYAKSNSTDCASIATSIQMFNSTLANGGTSAYLLTNFHPTNQVLGVISFYLEDPLNPSATPLQTGQSTFNEIQTYGGHMEAIWPSSSVVEGKTYKVVLQFGYANYLGTETEMTPTSTSYVPFGVVYSSGDFCSVSLTLTAV